jgi:predicted Zn finger-like uncharacterized protein
MPDLMNCPQCERRVRVPDELRGRSVKCPTCGTVFTAPSEAAQGVSEVRTEEEELAPTEIYQDESIQSKGELPPGAYEAPQRPRRPRRVDLKPHRGALILVLGILSIVVCGFLGPAAWIMGSSDLKEIRAGRMDSEGEATTNAGRICGIIGTFVQLVIPLCCGPILLILLFSSRAAVHQGF